MGRRPPLLQYRRRMIGLVTLAAGAASVSALVFLFDPAKYEFYPICYLHLVTGLSCPGCGATRAFHEILHGHLREAVRLNLLFVMSLPVVVGSIGWRIVAFLSGHSGAHAVRPVWLYLFLAIAVAFTLIRNLPGFEWLSP